MSENSENGAQLSLFGTGKKRGAGEVSSNSKAGSPENSISEDSSPGKREMLRAIGCALRKGEGDPLLLRSSARQAGGSEPVIPLALLSIFAELEERPNERVLLLDGGNVFDPYIISEAAHYLGRSPGRVLDRLEISRAFTCHQMWNLICEQAPAEMRRQKKKPAAVFVLDLLKTFYDEDVSREEALYLLTCCREKIAELADTTKFLLIEHPPPQKASERADFLQRLGSVCPVRLRLGPHGVEKTPA